MDVCTCAARTLQHNRWSMLWWSERLVDMCTSAARQRSVSLCGCLLVQALLDSGVCVAVIVEECTSAMGRNSKNRWHAVGGERP